MEETSTTSHTATTTSPNPSVHPERSEVCPGHIYRATISGDRTEVEILKLAPNTPQGRHGGWIAKNLKTDRNVHIKTAQRLSIVPRSATARDLAAKRANQYLSRIKLAPTTQEDVKEMSTPTSTPTTEPVPATKVSVDTEDLNKLSVRELAQLWFANQPTTRHLVQVNGQFADVKFAGHTRRFKKADLIAAIQVDAEADAPRVPQFDPHPQERPNQPTHTQVVTQSAPRPTPTKTTEPRPCACGCRSLVTSKKGRFLSGHDARFYGLIKRVLEGRLPADHSTVTPEVLHAIETGVCGHGVFRPAYISTITGRIPYTGQPQSVATLAPAAKAATKVSPGPATAHTAPVGAKRPTPAPERQDEFTEEDEVLFSLD